MWDIDSSLDSSSCSYFYFVSDKNSICVWLPHESCTHCIETKTVFKVSVDLLIPNLTVFCSFPGNTGD